jgi:hypothetical protein
MYKRVSEGSIFALQGALALQIYEAGGTPKLAA